MSEKQAIARLGKDTVGTRFATAGDRDLALQYGKTSGGTWDKPTAIVWLDENQTKLVSDLDEGRYIKLNFDLQRQRRIIHLQVVETTVP